MAKRRPSKNELLRAVDGLPDYPAVLWPLAEGGFEVVFPNLAKLKAYGNTREAALLSAGILLTAHLQPLVEQGQGPPRPSAPERLIPDQDEPLGTELVSVSPDKQVLLRRLGLEKDRQRGLAMASLGRLGR